MPACRWEVEKLDALLVKLRNEANTAATGTAAIITGKCAMFEQQRDRARRLLEDATKVATVIGAFDQQPQQAAEQVYADLASAAPGAVDFDASDGASDTDEADCSEPEAAEESEIEEE